MFMKDVYNFLKLNFNYFASQLAYILKFLHFPLISWNTVLDKISTKLRIKRAWLPWVCRYTKFGPYRFLRSFKVSRAETSWAQRTFLIHVHDVSSGPNERSHAEYATIKQPGDTKEKIISICCCNMITVFFNALDSLLLLHLAMIFIFVEFSSCSSVIASLNSSFLPFLLSQEPLQALWVHLTEDSCVCFLL